MQFAEGGVDKTVQVKQLVAPLMQPGSRFSEQAAKLQALREAIALGLASGPDLSEDEVYDALEVRLQAMVEKAA